MIVPILTFFNHKSGVGKTSLVYHLAWMLSQMNDRDGSPYRVLVCDLDPQANLTAAFLDEEQLEALWEDGSRGSTISKCVEPLQKVGDLLPPAVQEITPSLGLIPGDLALSWFEDRLSSEWPEARGSADLYRPFRILTAFWTVMQAGAAQMGASIILADVGPNLGAINRSALIATNHVVVPLGTDLFSLQGLRNLGPTLIRWRQDWKKSLENWSEPEFPLPSGQMQPIGYVVQQHSVRLSRPVRAHDKWVNRMPEAYARNLLGKSEGPFPETPQQDPHCLATIKHFRSLVPMAQEARKPIFDLTAADGAIGSHAAAVGEARKDFHGLAKLLTERMGLGTRTTEPELHLSDIQQGV